MNNINLFKARKLSDGAEIQGILLQFEPPFTYIVTVDSLKKTYIEGLNEEKIAMHAIRVLENSIRPVD